MRSLREQVRLAEVPLKVVTDDRVSEHAPVAPFLAIDRDGWLYGLRTAADVAGELEETDVAGGEYEIYDREARRIAVRFRGGSVELRLEGQEQFWAELQVAIRRFFDEQGLTLDTRAERDLVVMAVRSLRGWAT